MNPLIKAYGQSPRWVNWKLVDKDGRPTKVPINPTNQRLASSTNPSTWTTYPAAKKADPDHIGIVFTDARTLLGIDIDHVLSPEGDIIQHATTIELLINTLDTYTEISPSGTGLHLYVALAEPLTLEANRHLNFECYTSGRYFTTTFNPFRKLRPLSTLPLEEVITALHLLGYPWQEKQQQKRLANTRRSTRAISHPSAAESPQPLDTTTILERMFSSSNGLTIRALYDGDTSHYQDDHSRADAALLSHLAFWTQKDPRAMEAIWLASPLGKREKTQERQDYRTASINAAIAHCENVYTPVPPSAAGTSSSPDDVEDGTPMQDKLPTIEEMNLLSIVKNKERVYFKNTENVARILKKHPVFSSSLRFDAYRNIIERYIDGGWRPLEDRDSIDIQTKISVLFPQFAAVSKDMVFDAIVKVAYDERIDSGADYLRSLVWDGVPRLDTWLSLVYHTPQDEYHATIGANYLKGLVKRIISPGCKFDFVLVLEGAQGVKKSMSLNVLAGNLGHVETTISSDEKDFFMLMQGNAIVEFSEGETLSRTEVKQLKSVISTAVDKYRAPYGRATADHPRRCVFAMTTNQTEYLKDETGNRRWLPVETHGLADVEWLATNREQLLAEAYARVVNRGESVHEFPMAELEEAQLQRRVKDPNIEVIVNWYWSQPPSLREKGFSITDVYIGALHGGFMAKPMSRHDEVSVSDVMKTWLRLEPRRVMQGSMRYYKFFPTEKTKLLEPTFEERAQISPVQTF